MFYKIIENLDYIPHHMHTNKLFYNFQKVYQQSGLADWFKIVW